MKRTLIAFAVAAALPVSALAQMNNQGATPPKSPTTSSSPAASSPQNRLDTNKDGFISRDEAKGSADVSRRFGELDKDHDGKLSPSELSSTGGQGSAPAPKSKY